MPASNFSIGRDCQVVVMGPTGRIDLSHVTGFDSKQLTQPVRVNRMDGQLLGAELPKGWEGGFDVERGTSSIDDFISAIENGYFTSGQLGTGTLYQYVTEANGSTSTYQYGNVVFSLAGAGQWKGDSSVKQRLEFYAATRARI